MTPNDPTIVFSGLHLQAAAPAPVAPGDDAYEPATGTSREDRELLATLEDKAAAKTASDYEHIVWAYGILWALFAAYGLFLWRRSVRLRADVDALRRAVDEAPRGPQA